MTQRIGIGFDVHRFVKGRKLFLGGIEVPYTLGLDGHSDADVVLHAICDAILGALGRGDIGEHFPNSEARYKNIASVELLRQVYGLVKKDGYGIANVDVVVLAEEPNLKNYKARMKALIAKELGLMDAKVNIKATTNEGMGFVGRKEGMASYATVLLIKVS